jgi:amino acid transporter
VVSPFHCSGMLSVLVLIVLVYLILLCAFVDSSCMSNFVVATESMEWLFARITYFMLVILFVVFVGIEMPCCS